MKISLARICSIAASLSMTAFILSSCINENYSSDKELDGTIVILKELVMPIGNIEKISVGKIIPVDENDQMISKDAEGDYTFNFSGGNPFSVNFKVPSFSIPFEDGTQAEDHYIKINTGTLKGQNGSAINKKITLSGQRLEKVIKVQNSHKLPYQIVDIKSVESELVLDYTFSTNAGAVYLSKGFTIDFPDWMVVEKCDNRTDYVVETQGINKNVVRFTSDLKIGSTKDEVLDLKISAINLPDGAIVDAGNDSEGRPCKKINIDDENSANKIIAAGDVYVQTSDFPVIPEEAELKMHLEFSNFDIKSAEAKINMTTTVPDKEFPVVDYPDFFTMEGVVMDIYNPEIVFDFVNSLDVDFSFSADINAYKNSEQKVTAHIGGESDFIIPADKSSEIVISRNHLKNLGEILKVLPDNIMISNMQLSSKDKSSPDEYSTLKPGHQFSCSVAYALRAALAFGPDFCLPYSMDINDLGEAFSELGLKSANLLMTVENTIPLNFAITSAALDENGNPKNDVTIEVNGNVPSGTLDSPSANTLGIKISTTADALELNTLRLNMTATCPSAQHQGVPLNENQGLHIKSLAISLPDGITMDLNK